MPKQQVSDASAHFAPQQIVPTCVMASSDALEHMKGVIPMNFALPHLVRDLFRLSAPHDEHLLAGADEAAVQALGVSQPVLARFQQDVAILCPDLVHEAQLGLGRK